MVMVELKTAAQIQTMAGAGRIIAAALAAVRQQAAVGVRLCELDEVAASVIADAGAKPSFLHYRPAFAATPFPAVICASVNDVVVHGIPGDYRLADGDLVSIDCGANVDGLHGDSAISFIVGNPRPGDSELIDTTVRALEAGIAAAVPDGRLGDIASAVGVIGRVGGYGIPRELGGHGVGRSVHEDPQLANEGSPGRGMRMRPGLVLAIEPMFLAGGRDGLVEDDDGWALRSADGSRAAHAEHTVAVTQDGPVVLTARAVLATV